MTLKPPIDWDAAFAAHDEHVTAAEAQAAEWVWATNASWAHLEPIWDERHGRHPMPKRLDGEPERKPDAELYGFDAHGRMVVAREFGDGFGNDDVVKREVLRVGDRVFVYETQGARGVYRSHLAELRLPTYDPDGRLVRLESWWLRPGEGFYDGIEEYDYADARLVAVRKRGGRELRVAYDEDGELATVVGGNDEILYRRPAGDELDAAFTLVRAELPGRLVAWARRVAPDEPVGAVALQYGEAYNSAFPPAFALVTRRSLDADPDIAPYPADYDLFDDEPEELNDPRLADAFEVINQAWRSDDDDDDPSERFFAELIAALPALGYPVRAIQW